jgi:DNA topoisomerase-1
MAKSLVIVESPAKSNTINKILGKNFTVTSSMGHIMDLPKSKMGIDIKKGFTPEYIMIPGKKKIVDALKKAALEVDNIFLATDPDREGEAISWHLANLLGKKKKKLQRLR